MAFIHVDYIIYCFSIRDGCGVDVNNISVVYVYGFYNNHTKY